MSDDYAKDERLMAIQARIRKGRRKGATCLCDYCGRVEGSTQHEIFPKSLTRKDSYERDLCLHRTVISLLCLQCHLLIQNDSQANRELLAFNRNLWGSDAVNAHIKEMRDEKIRVDFQERLYD